MTQLGWQHRLTDFSSQLGAQRMVHANSKKNQVGIVSLPPVFFLCLAMADVNFRLGPINVKPISLRSSSVRRSNSPIVTI